LLEHLPGELPLQVPVPALQSLFVWQVDDEHLPDVCPVHVPAPRAAQSPFS
jgi:hypothetical protein